MKNKELENLFSKLNKNNTIEVYESIYDFYKKNKENREEIEEDIIILSFMIIPVLFLIFTLALKWIDTILVFI